MLRNTIKCLQGCRTKITRQFICSLACTCVCMLTRLLCLVIDGTAYFLVLFFCTWFSGVLLHSTYSQWEPWCSNIWKNQFLCCRRRLPLMHPQLWKVLTALYSTASASSFVPCKFCNAAPSDQCKNLWHRKTKSVGTAQNKLNCKIKRAQAILLIALFSFTFI